MQQEELLEKAKADETPVTIILTNGVQLKGNVAGYDKFCIILQQDGQQLVYKHFISTIVLEE